MPRATVSQATTRIDLTTLEGGYVVLRRMPYGKWLERSEKAMNVSAQMGGGKNTPVDIEMLQRAVTEFEFRECITDHNLEDDNDELLDFRRPGILNVLDPQIGNEIAELIREMHEFDLGKSDTGSSV